MADLQSTSCFERAKKVIVGGVNSPARAFRAVGSDPIFIRQARGAQIVAVDGTEYLDYVGSWGPAIVGHAHPEVLNALHEAASKGLSFGAPTEEETFFAEQLIALYPSIAKIRCVSSGTEATMSALRAARAHTGRSLIIKFEGCYHGHADHLLVKAGSGLATHGVPSSAGVPDAIAKSTLALRYNDLDQLKRTFQDAPRDIAAVIVEPVVGNMGCISPVDGFLKGLIELCDTFGAVSIFDEVMTGCRLAPGGAQGLYGLRPDLTCLGKVIGGGMPLAAYGGRSDIMAQVAPDGPCYQAGTLSGNPLAVAVGRKTLDLLTPRVYEHLEALGARLEQGLKRVIVDKRVRACVQRVGSMITLFFCDGPVRCWDDASKADTARFAAWHAGLIQRRVYWPPSQFEAAFLSAAHTEQDVDRTVQAAWESMPPA